MDIFLQKDVQKLLKHKKVVFIGDSNIRAVYKDLLCLLHQTKFISQKTLKTKNENSCFGDKLMTNGPKTNGRNYKEERKAEINNSSLSFYFITRIYDSYVREILENLTRKSKIPDVIIVNSCVWDVTRWGPNGVDSYKNNLKTFMKELKKLMPDCLVIWVTAPPIACELKGGFLVKELEFLRYSVRFHVMEANHYARRIVIENGFDVVDTHYHLMMQLHRRGSDGIHWLPEAVRYVTNLLLSHISLAWNVPLPHRYKPKSEVPDLVLEEKSTTKAHETHESKSTKKISSVIKVMPTSAKSKSTENNIENKWEKENCDNKSHPQKRKRLDKKRKQDVGESHHTYLSKVQKQERHQRIRNWQSSTYVDSSPRNSYANFRVDYSSSSSQNDSGYFPSPNHLQYSPQPFFSPQMYASGPIQIPLPGERYLHDRYSVRASAAPDLMFNYNTPIQRNLPHKRHASMYATNFSFSNDQFSTNHVRERDPRQFVHSASSKQMPYVFSNITQHPIIDFTSTNAIPFGFQF